MVYALIGIIIIALALWTWKKPRQANVIVWALVATLCVSAAALKLLPGSFATNVIWYAATVPLIWAAVQVWVYWEPKAWKVTASLVGATLVSGAVIALVPSPV